MDSPPSSTPLCPFLATLSRGTGRGPGPQGAGLLHSQGWAWRQMPGVRDKLGTVLSAHRVCVWRLGGAARSCFGNFLGSWADTPNYYLERFGEAR